MKKYVKFFFSIILIIIALHSINISFAHGGRTDSNGGHYDRSTGEYHYHHGYPTHQHINGICPYNYDNQIVYSAVSTTSNQNDNVDTSSNTYTSSIPSLVNELHKRSSENTNNIYSTNISSLNNVDKKDSTPNYTLYAIIIIFLFLFILDIINQFIEWLKNKFKLKHNNTTMENNIKVNDPKTKSEVIKKYYNKYYTCPKCGNILILKNGKYGYFYRL